MTRSMTRWTLVGCMALAAVGAAAVLDVGAPTAHAAPSVSPFAGTYVSSAWPVPITISDSGRISSSYSGAERENGSISGRVRDDGSFSWTRSVTLLIFPNRGKEFWHTFRDTFDGIMTSDADGNVVGTGEFGVVMQWTRQ